MKEKQPLTTSSLHPSPPPPSISCLLTWRLAAAVNLSCHVIKCQGMSFDMMLCDVTSWYASGASGASCHVFVQVLTITWIRYSRGLRRKQTSHIMSYHVNSCHVISIHVIFLFRWWPLRGMGDSRGLRRKQTSSFCPNQRNTKTARANVTIRRGQSFLFCECLFFFVLI